MKPTPRQPKGKSSATTSRSKTPQSAHPKRHPLAVNRDVPITPIAKKELNMAGPYPTGGNEGVVANIYLGMLNRLPDEGGFQYFLGVLNAGLPVVTIANNISGSPEYVAAYGGLSNADFVAKVYWQILGRAPEAVGFMFFTGELDKGRLTKGDVISNIAYQTEARQVLAARYPGGFYTS